MQPNGNIPGAAQPASPVRPVAPVGPTKPVNPAAPVKPAAPAGGPTFDNGPSVVDGKGSKKTGWILAVVLLLIVAIGGVGFGVWAMMDGNAQKDALNSQISALKQQNNDLQEQLGNGEGGIAELYIQENPIITSSDSESISVQYSLSVVKDNNDVGWLNFVVKDGVVESCTGPAGADCSISGVPEGVYKMAVIHEGNGIGDEKIGFIMKDGTVWYAPVYSSNGTSINSNFEAKKVKLDGFVKDIIEVGYIDDAGYGFGSTIFVLNDGSYVKYDDSMFD